MLKEEKEIVEMLMTKFVLLNDFEKQFCQSLYKIRNGRFSLSEKQKAILDKTNELYWNKKCDIKTKPNALIVLTEKIFNSGKSANGGWSYAQLECFGERFEKGWKRRIIGKKYPKEVIDKFLSLKSVKERETKTEITQFTPQEKDEIVKLAIDCAEDYNPELLIAWFQKKLCK